MHDHGNCARCDAQEERIARLEGALTPFSRLAAELRPGYADTHVACSIRVDDLTRACAALDSQPPRDTAEWQRVHGAAAQAARDVAHWRTRAENAEARLAQLEGRDE